MPCHSIASAAPKCPGHFGGPFTSHFLGRNRSALRQGPAGGGPLVRAGRRAPLRGAPSGRRERLWIYLADALPLSKRCPATASPRPPQNAPGISGAPSHLTSSGGIDPPCGKVPPEAGRLYAPDGAPRSAGPQVAGGERLWIYLADALPLSKRCPATASPRPPQNAPGISGAPSHLTSSGGIDPPCGKVPPEAGRLYAPDGAPRSAGPQVAGGERLWIYLADALLFSKRCPATASRRPL